MRARKYYQRTGKKITINGSDTVGYDKSKVECFNCHKMGHFARECRGLFVNSSLEEFQQPEFKGYGPKASKSVYVDTSNEVKKTPDTPLVEELVLEKGKQTVFPTKIEFVKQQDKTARKPGTPPTDDQGYVDSGCCRHMTGNISYLSDFQEFDGGYVTFGGGVRGGKITSKGTLKTGKLDFQDVLFVKELQFNLFSVSQMCDKKNRVVFTDTTCFVLSPDFKLPDESQILLKIPRKNNMYSVDMKKMDNLVRGLPSKCFENDQTCVACLKGKQHKASCKSKVQNSITQPLFMLHMDLFGPNFVSSLMNRKYCLVVTDDYSRFTWVFFLASKDETSGILKSFINEIENLVDKKVKIIRCHNRTEFKNRVMNEFCEQKGIKREYSIARTPQQNGVAKRRNRTLIEAARTMFANSKLPTTFWAEAVNTACCVQNRVIIVKPHNKTPYELFRGRTPALSFMRLFGFYVCILNTLDYLGKFDWKSDDGFFVGYSLTSKAFRVYNIRTRKVEENLHIRFLEDKPIVLRDGPKWLFDIDSLTKSINYVPVIAGTNSNDFVGSEKDYSLFDSPLMNVSHDKPEPSCDAEKKDDEGVSKVSGVDDQERPKSSTPNINTAGPSINTASANLRTGSLHINTVNPTVLTTRSNRPQYISDIISLRDNVTPEATNADLFGDVTEMDMSNLNASYHEEPKRVTKALSDLAWVEAMQEELLYQEEVIDYDEVFAPIARIEAIRLFLAYASFMGFMVYQMDVKSAFLYGGESTIWVASSSKSMMSSVGELTFFLGLQVKQKEDGIFISQGKYVTDILKKFGFQDVRIASTLMDTKKPLLKDSDGDDVDVHLYRPMIGALMYLTLSRPDIIYLKGKPKLGLWYPRDSPFDLVAYSDSDYAGASLDRKSTTGGCQFLGCRLISWQCKKQTMVATSSTEAEYVAAASCCGQDKQIECLKLNASPLKHVKRGRDTKIPQSSGPPVKVGDEAVHKELGDKMERAATTASSLKEDRSRKPEGSEAFHQILDFLNTCHIKYALIDFLNTQTQVADGAAFISVDVDAGEAATIDIGLEAGQGSGTMHKTPTRPHDSPLLRVHTLRSDESSLQQNELMDLVTKLTDRVEVLENDL
ncbi:putative ribonuclease H-like domain-containing protein [Tanacetum coccineum]